MLSVSLPARRTKGTGLPRMQRGRPVFCCILFFAILIPVNIFCANQPAWAADPLQQQREYGGLMPNYIPAWHKTDAASFVEKNPQHTLDLILEGEPPIQDPGPPDWLKKIIDAIVDFFLSILGVNTQTDNYASDTSPSDTAPMEGMQTGSVEVITPPETNDTIAVNASVSDLIEQLSSPDATTRRTAAQALGELRDPAAIGPLVNALGDTNRQVRQAAAHALGQIGVPAIDPLIAVLSSRDPIVREAASWALVEIGQPAVDPLVRALYSTDTNVRTYAAAALEDIGAPAVNGLITALFSSDPGVRRMASWTLSRIGEPAVQPLVNALGTTDANARKAMQEALVWIGEPAVVPLVASLNASNAVAAEAAAEVLVSMGEPALRQVLSSLNLQMTGDFSYQRATELLVSGLADPAIRNRAALILAKLGEPSIEPLIQALRDPSLKDGARQALIMIGEPAFIPVIEGLLSSADPLLRQEGALIIQGIAQRTGNSLDPSIDILGMASASKQDLRNIASTNAHPATRALALYFLGTRYNDSEFLKQYLFDETLSGLRVRNRGATELEMAAILHTGIPARDNWWARLASREDRIAYLELALKGDFTDRRIYIGEDRAWLCVQFAQQLSMNFNGYDGQGYADQAAFEEYGAGYVIQPLEDGYGVPVYYATTGYFSDNITGGGGHAFNAVFIGDGPVDDDPENWILIEPEDDDFSPNMLATTVTIHIGDFLVLPDGNSGGNYRDSRQIIIDVTDYQPGSD